MPLRTSSIRGVSIPCLVPLTASGTRPPIILADPSIVIGSGDAAQIRLKSLSVSKAHALLLVDDGKAYVRDLASRTELFVNDLAVREAVLKHGDVVRVGKFAFGVVEDPTVAELKRPQPPAPTVLIRVDDEAELRRVTDPVVLIGRRARCDINLADDSLSGAHAVMFRIGRRWFLRDLTSRTGTLVNGALIRQQKGLEDGDLIRVGRVDIRFLGEERISAPYVAPQVVAEQRSSGVEVSEVAAGAPAPAGASPDVHVEVAASSFSDGNIFGMTSGAAAAAVVAPGKLVDEAQTPLPGLGQSDLPAVESRPEAAGVMSLTFHPMPNRDVEVTSDASGDEERRGGELNATDAEWDQNVTVWGFEDLVRRGSGDHSGEEPGSDGGRGVIWAAVAVGVLCLGMMAWLIAYKL